MIVLKDIINEAFDDCLQRMKNMSIFTTIIVFMLGVASSSFALTGAEILRAMDANRDHISVSAQATMEIHIGSKIRTKTMEMISLSKGNKSLVTFTNPEDAGTKYLLRGDDLWIYFPDENDVVKISGHMLKEGMMGSDVSYEDALESDELTQKYTIKITAEEKYAEKDCYVIQLDAKTKDAPYYKRIMWVEKNTSVAWKEEMYAKSGRLLKESRVIKVEKIGSRYYPVVSETVNALRKNSKTLFSLHTIVLDTPVDEQQFTLRNLKR